MRLLLPLQTSLTTLQQLQGIRWNWSLNPVRLHGRLASSGNTQGTLDLLLSQQVDGEGLWGKFQGCSLPSSSFLSVLFLQLFLSFQFYYLLLLESAGAKWCRILCHEFLELEGEISKLPNNWAMSMLLGFQWLDNCPSASLVDKYGLAILGETLASYEGVHEVKAIFMITLRSYLSFSVPLSGGIC